MTAIEYGLMAPDRSLVSRWPTVWPVALALALTLIPVVHVGGLRVPPVLVVAAPVMGVWYLYLRTAGALESGWPELLLAALCALIFMGDATDWLEGVWVLRINEYVKVFWYFTLYRVMTVRGRTMDRPSALWLQAGLLIIATVGIAEYFNLGGIKTLFGSYYVIESQQAGFLQGGEGGESRVTSTLMNPNYYSLFMVLAFWWTYTSPHLQRRSKFLMCGWLAIAVLPGQSRTAVGILLVLTLMLMFSEVGHWTWLILSPAAVAVVAFARQHLDALNYLFALFRSSDLLWHSLLVRVDVWADFAEHATRDPLTFLWGYDHGPSGNTYTYDSYYVELVARDGLPFLLGLSVPFGRCLWRRGTPWARGFLLLLLVAGITMPFYGNFQFTSVALIMAALGDRRI